MNSLLITGGPCQRGQEFELSAEAYSITMSDGRIAVTEGFSAGDVLLLRRKGSYVFCGSASPDATLNRESASQRRLRSGDEMRVGPFRLQYETDVPLPPEGPRAVGVDWLRAAICSLGLAMLMLIAFFLQRGPKGESGNGGGGSGISDSGTGIGTGSGSGFGSGAGPGSGAGESANGTGAGVAGEGKGGGSSVAGIDDPSAEPVAETPVPAEAVTTPAEETAPVPGGVEAEKAGSEAPTAPVVDTFAILSPGAIGTPPPPAVGGTAGFGGGTMAKPKNAITKGSFSVWTVPENPNPNQDYVIYIQVTLPDTVTVYDMSDLSGVVRGTDGFREDISYPQGQKINVEDNIVQVTVEIPGAANLVRDVIVVRSRLLSESQNMEIVF